ncbi:D-2-hydroxyacid dehydrogenase [Bacillus sp. T3]|uniref:D-2-hydroxyacid dehydrogenase n=1 Tax=Bacillus sp. T3 TaxID=467262 RepID=UPI00298103F2|nr:D-2-hydroxyacid dehydrogenase [Bacillus sp. T3]
MVIKNILVISPMYKEVQRLIEKEALPYCIHYLAEERLNEAELDWADALVCFNLKADIDYSGVKWVHSLGAGVDRFLYGKKWDEKVLLTRTICSFGQRIAQYSLSYILQDLQAHQKFAENEKQKNWQPYTPGLLSEQKLMIYGTGEIGQTVAKVLSSFGVKVYGVSLSGTKKDYFHEVLSIDTHYTRLNEMNFVINTLPLTEQTYTLFNKDIFQHTRNIGFINVGRGASLDEIALLEALAANQVRFAVLDVFSQEPLPKEHPFWEHPSIVITPHISAVTTPEEGVACFIETLNNIEENKPLRNIVNPSKGY